jgi:tripartite-type tricarboxylate transporter receptor subunit TctC
VPDLITAIANGGLDAGVEVIAPSLPLIQSGALRPLATTGRERSPELAGTPTAGELGIPFRHTSWNGIIAPRRTPPPVIDRLNREFHRILQQPDILERFRTLGVTPRYGTLRTSRSSRARRSTPGKPSRRCSRGVKPGHAGQQRLSLCSRCPHV